MANLPHTPTPWTPHNGNARTVASVLSGGSVPVAVFSNATDADFAMLAANCHDDLVAALGDKLRILDAVRYSSGLGTKQLDRMDRARIAFAKAKGGAQ